MSGDGVVRLDAAVLAVRVLPVEGGRDLLVVEDRLWRVEFVVDVADVDGSVRGAQLLAVAARQWSAAVWRWARAQS